MSYFTHIAFVTTGASVLIPIKALYNALIGIINLIANEKTLRKNKFASQMPTNRNSRFERKDAIDGILRQNRSFREKTQ